MLYTKLKEFTMIDEDNTKIVSCIKLQKTYEQNENANWELFKGTNKFFFLKQFICTKRSKMTIINNFKWVN